MELMLTSTLLAMLLGAGSAFSARSSAIRCSTRLATIGAMIALSIPTFWFGLVAIYVFSVGLGWLPAGNRHTSATAPS
jgi:peptide/nickel transport system permease protein